MPQIIDGCCGEPHVEPIDTWMFNASLVGDGIYRTSIAEKCAVSLADANTINISKGEFVAQGVRCRIPNTEEIKIANGVSGMNRHDLLLAHYVRDPETNTDSVSWRIAQGQSTTGDPVDPDYIKANVLEGATEAEWPFARIKITGLVPSEPEPLTEVYQPYPSEVARLDEFCDSISQEVSKVVFDGATEVSFSNWINGGRITISRGSNTWVLAADDVYGAHITINGQQIWHS